MKKKLGIGCLGLIGFFILLLIIVPKKERTESEPPEPQTPIEIKAPEKPISPIDNLSIENFKWKTGGFDNIMVASFTVQNKNDFDVKDIKIRCIVEAKSGTELNRPSKTIFDIVPKNGSKRFEDVSLGFINTQAHIASCRVASFDK